MSVGFCGWENEKTHPPLEKMILEKGLWAWHFNREVFIESGS